MDIQQIIHDIWEGDNELSPEERVVIEKALQEQAEREKGCEYCNDYEPNYNQFYDSEGELGARFVFCPMCGRRLK